MIHLSGSAGDDDVTLSSTRRPASTWDGGMSRTTPDTRGSDCALESAAGGASESRAGPGRAAPLRRARSKEPEDVRRLAGGSGSDSRGGDVCPQL